MNKKTKTLEEMRSPQQLQEYRAPVPVARGIFDFHNTTVMDRAVDMAQKLARSPMVPDIYRRQHENDQGSIANCLIALDLADRMGANPLMVMQNLSVIKGKPSWSGQYIIAAINQSGRFAEPLHFEFFGTEGQMDYGCWAETTTKTGKVIKGPKITMQLAKNEGWMKNPKWVNMPDLMLRYRAGAWFGKTECPELLMGINNSTEELEDMKVIEVDVETGEVLGEEGKPTKFVDMQADIKAPAVKAEVKTSKKKTTKKKVAKRKEEPPKEETAPPPKEELPPADDVNGTALTPEHKEPEPEMTNAEADRATQIQDQGYYEDSGRFFNEAGEMWDPSKHATSKATSGPIVNSNGSFRVRRGGTVEEVAAKKEADPIPDVPDHAGQQPQEQQNIDDMGDWE